MIHGFTPGTLWSLVLFRKVDLLAVYQDHDGVMGQNVRA